MTPASWTPSPIVEREVESERRAAFSAVWIGRTVLALGVASFPLTCFGIAAGSFWPVPAIGLFIGALWLNARVTDWRERTRLAVWARDAETVEEFGWGDAWLVDLTILQGLGPTGIDRGMLWFEDDRLVFSGRRTSFALGKAEVAGTCREVRPIPGIRHALMMRLNAGHPARPVSLSLSPVYRAKWQLESKPADVLEAVERWRLSSPPLEAGLPPLTLGPGVPSRGRLFVQAVQAVAVWSLLFVLLASSLWTGAIALAGMTIAMGGLLALAMPAFHGPILRLLAWWDRHRIEAEL